MSRQRIAIIGAGIAGLTLSRHLVNSHDIHVFDKARGVGGRMANRYHRDWIFDHGAQFIVSRSSPFEDHLLLLQRYGLVARWHARTGRYNAPGQFSETVPDSPLYVPTPKINSWAKYLADGLQVRTQTHIAALTRHQQQWMLTDKSGDTFGPFDSVVLAMPPRQSHDLLKETGFARLDNIDPDIMAPVHTVMLGFDSDPGLPFDLARGTGGILDVLSVSSSKPGRDTPYSLVLHTDSAWSRRHLSTDAHNLASTIITAARDLTGTDLSAARVTDQHRWLYATADKPSDRRFIADDNAGLYVIGDWLSGNRVEGAWQSGMALAHHFDAHMHGLPA